MNLHVYALFFVFFLEKWTRKKVKNRNGNVKNHTKLVSVKYVPFTDLKVNPYKVYNNEICGMNSGKVGRLLYMSTKSDGPWVSQKAYDINTRIR